MSVCNVFACANCSIKGIRPDSCPILLSQRLNQPTLIVGITSEEDELEHSLLGINCFKTSKFTEVCFVHCSCLSGEVVSKSYSIKRLSPEGLEVSREITNVSQDRQGISYIS